MAVKILKNIQLKDKVTFNIPAVAGKFVEITDPNLELLELFENKIEPPIYILGEGSNTVFMSNFPGTVIHFKTNQINLISEDKQSVLVEVDAGVIWVDFVKYAISNGWGQVENLSHIPGTVGASPVQNIGAYGLELNEIVDSVYGFDIHSKEFRWMTNDECGFNYRTSIFKTSLKDKFIITKVRYRLSKQGHYKLKLDYPDVKAKISEKNLSEDSITSKKLSEIIIEIRTYKLPDWKKIGTAGSFFQNPIIVKSQFDDLLEKYPELPSYQLPQTDMKFDTHVKIPAAWLIDKAGWKGKEFKTDDYHYGVSPRQALVLVNYRGQTAEQLHALKNEIQLNIEQKYGINLIPEVNLIG